MDPRPELPRTFADIMKMDLPAKYTTTADGREFLVMNSWTNNTENESLMVFISNTGADILKTAPVWLMDGTYRISPVPFYQVITFI